MSFRKLLSREFDLSPLQLDQLERHYILLMRWNEKLNLTRIRSMDEAVKLHYAEALFLAQQLPAGLLRIGDVGSGGGFPGVPIAISRTESSISLIESDKRKAVFLSEASRGLSNVDVKAERAEDLVDQFDWVVSRAVRPADVLKLRVARRFAILTTVTELAGLPTPSCVAKYPHGDKRIVAMFHVEHDKIDEVSRIDENRGEDSCYHEPEGRGRKDYNRD